MGSAPVKLLLDTHIWLWYGLGNNKLAETLRTVVAEANNELWISPISVWETLLLAEKGKITLQPDPIEWIKATLKLLGAREATLNYNIAVLSRQIACPHKDPADRFIAATAVHYNLKLVTVDQNLSNTPLLDVIDGSFKG